MIVPFLLCLFSESCIKDYCSCIFKMPKEPEVANHNQPNYPEPILNRRETEQQIAEIQNDSGRFENNARQVSFVPFQRITSNKAKSNIMRNWKKVFMPNNSNRGEY